MDGIPYFKLEIPIGQGSYIKVKRRPEKKSKRAKEEIDMRILNLQVKDEMIDYCQAF
jgi:hypothetical protein